MGGVQIFIRQTWTYFGFVVIEPFFLLYFACATRYYVLLVVLAPYLDIFLRLLLLVPRIVPMLVSLDYLAICWLLLLFISMCCYVMLLRF